jgi:hypothetical protein
MPLSRARGFHGNHEGSLMTCITIQSREQITKSQKFIDPYKFYTFISLSGEIQ